VVCTHISSLFQARIAEPLFTLCGS